MLVSEAAKQIGINPQTLRLALQQGKFPFGVAIKTSPKRYTYYINRNQLNKYLEGTLYEGTDNVTPTSVNGDRVWT